MSSKKASERNTIFVLELKKKENKKEKREIRKAESGYFSNSVPPLRPPILAGKSITVGLPGCLFKILGSLHRNKPQVSRRWGNECQTPR